MRAVARARANIALVKYWGKASNASRRGENLPAVGSLSLTLDALWTRTEVQFHPEPGADRLEIGGRAVEGEALGRVSRFLDRVRGAAHSGRAGRAEVRSENNFPTASGLASSASAFAALAGATTRALGLAMPPEELASLARTGSGSAARSIFGGFVLMDTQGRTQPLVGPDFWDVRLVLALTAEGEKATSSTTGMEATARSSPYFPAWVATHAVDLEQARQALLRRDLAALGEIAEHNCLKMHASALAARPGVLYWNGATVDCIHLVRSLRARGTPAYFTIDAGPHVKVLCDAESAPAVAAALAQVPGVKTRVAGPGAGVEILEGD